MWKGPTIQVLIKISPLNLLVIRTLFEYSFGKMYSRTFRSRTFSFFPQVICISFKSFFYYQYKFSFSFKIYIVSEDCSSSWIRRCFHIRIKYEIFYLEWKCFFFFFFWFTYCPLIQRQQKLRKRSCWLKHKIKKVTPHYYQRNQLRDLYQYRFFFSLNVQGTPNNFCFGKSFKKNYWVFSQINEFKIIFFKWLPRLAMQ